METLYRPTPRTVFAGEQVTDGDSGLQIRGFPPVSSPLRRQIQDYQPSAPGYFNSFGQDDGNEQIPSSKPPAYETILRSSRLHSPKFNVCPRIEEGQEPLPDYSCSLTLENVFERKMEMDSPFDRSLERKWSKVFVVLKGTLLSVHKVKSPRFFSNPDNWAPASPDRPLGTSAGTKIKSYTLQQAEVGIAADYPKRHFVIRIRAEAHQFLLSCTTVETFLTWLECLGAAIDLAPPLDERSLPRYQTLPRRRRRNRVEIEQEQIELIERLYPNLRADPVGPAVERSGSFATAPGSPRTSEYATPPTSPRATSEFPFPTTTAEAGSPDPPEHEPSNNSRDPPRSPSLSEHDMDITPVTQEIERVPTTQKTPVLRASSQRRFLPGIPGIPSLSALRRQSTSQDSISTASMAQESVDSGDLRTAAAMEERLNPAGEGDVTREPEPITRPPSLDENGKWNPAHYWTEEHNIRYARRCMAVLVSDAPRQSDVIVRAGRRWKIQWSTQTLKPYDPNDPPEYPTPRQQTTPLEADRPLTMIW